MASLTAVAWPLSASTKSLPSGKAIRKTHHNGAQFFVIRASDPAAKVETATTNQPLKRGLVRTLFEDETYTAWPEVHRTLTERNMRSVDCEQAFEWLQSGEAVLLDVREPQDFEKIHAEGAISAPLFRLIQGNTWKANLRRLGHALIADFAGTERNPEFYKQALDAVNGDKSKAVVVMCDIGGTLKTTVDRGGSKPKSYADPDRRFGRASRSLRAIYELQEDGFSNTYHMIGDLISGLIRRSLWCKISWRSEAKRSVLFVSFRFTGFRDKGFRGFRCVI